jgi:diguanylate cyclase (GGDEF)-like protein
VRFYSGGIFRRQFLALFGTTAIFFGLTTLALLQVTGKAIIDRQLEVSSAYRDEMRSRVLGWLTERVSDVEYLATSFDADEGAALTPGNAAKSLALFCSVQGSYRNALLVDPKGSVVADRNGPVATMMSVASQDYFKAVAAGRSYAGGLVRGLRTGSAEIAIAVPLKPGSSGGYSVACFLLLEMVTAQVEDVSLKDMGKAYLVDSQGRIASTPAYAEAFRTLGPGAAGAPVDNFAARELKAGRSGAAEYVGYDGTRVVGAYASVEPLGLGLVVELSRDQALKPVTSIIESGLVFMALAVALLALISLYLSARLVAPIRKLIAAAEALRGGERIHLEVSSGTELDHLAELFNHMSAAVSEREEGLRESAARDSLTGLYNHARIEEFLDLEIRRRKRSGEKAAFVMLDIDRFKDVNDSYGHLAGDEALRGIARILEDSVRGGDIAGRYGGEEFSVILDARSDEEVASFCERIRARVEESSFASEGKEIRLTVSLGWVRAAAEGLGPYDFVRRADRALYAAKESGRNKVVGISGADPR